MQQAIYTSAHIESHSSQSGQATSVRFGRARLVLSVVGNVLGGAILLSGMLFLPELMVSLLAK